MKVECINNYNNHYDLTIGKTYEVFDEDNKKTRYWIIDDTGYGYWFPKECFKTLSELRNETINKLLGI